MTGAVTVLICALLAWNHYHGGIQGHHLLADKDLPRFSNAWGVLVLPLLTWLLLFRVQKRIFLPQNDRAESASFRSAIYGFVIALVYGIILSAFYEFGYPDFSGYMTIGIFVLALFFPVYRAEYFLGYVLGLFVSFGSVIPTIIGSVVLLICFLLYRFVRTAVLWMVSRLS
ncbi:MAG TPA: hypothetical protein DIS90_04775 [Cytophagales bacterium]|nr:hypothetical protein [Cytophagales bacterium]